MPQKVLTAEQIKAKWDLEKLGIAGGVSPAEHETLKQENEEFRRKGPSRQDLRKTLADLFKQYGIDPAEELIKIATETYEDNEGKTRFVSTRQERTDIYMKLLEYRYPKLKAVEMSGQIDASLTISIVRFGEDGTRLPSMEPRKIIDIDESKQLSGESTSG